jgi:hypothetical protein
MNPLVNGGIWIGPFVRGESDAAYEYVEQRKVCSRCDTAMKASESRCSFCHGGPTYREGGHGSVPKVSLDQVRSFVGDGMSPIVGDDPFVVYWLPPPEVFDRDCVFQRDFADVQAIKPSQVYEEINLLKRMCATPLKTLERQYHRNGRIALLWGILGFNLGGRRG